MRRGVIPELQHQRMPFERRLDDAALHAAAPAVHQTHLCQSRRHRRRHVLVDDRRDIARREAVEVELRSIGMRCNEISIDLRVQFSWQFETYFVRS